MTLITPGGAQKHGPLDLRAPTLCLVAQGAVSGFLALGFQGFGTHSRTCQARFLVRSRLKDSEGLGFGGLGFRLAYGFLI